MFVYVKQKKKPRHSDIIINYSFTNKVLNKTKENIFSVIIKRLFQVLFKKKVQALLFFIIFIKMNETLKLKNLLLVKKNYILKMI